MTHTDAERLNVDLFPGEEGTLTCVTTKIIKARKEHKCFEGQGSYGDKHIIPKGDRYYFQKALVDGSFWGQYRVCLPCVDKDLDGEF